MSISHREIVCEAFIKEWPKFKLEGNKMLDVGCHDEALKNYFNNLNLQWHGCDIRPVVEGVLKADMCYELPYLDDGFDLVFVCHAFEHTLRPMDALNELKRVLKPRGILFIATPSPCEGQITHGDADHLFVLNPMQMQKILAYNHFAEINTYLQTENIALERDYNVISICRK